MKFYTSLFLMLSLLSFSCKNENNNTEDTKDPGTNSTIEINEVEVMVLHQKPFVKEIICNGKISALEKSSLTFGVGEIIISKPFKNGDYIKKGTVIASLDKESLLKQLSQQQLQLYKATIDLEDKLISQGYTITDTANIPGELLLRAKLLSGYSTAQLELSNTKKSIHKSDLTAPFSGILSGIKHNLFDRISAGEEYCTIINTSSFMAEFCVLESEIGDISIGKEVEESSFSSDEFTIEGKIIEINPVVDDNGLIQVKALLNSSTGLMEGMNVKVRVKSSIPGKLVVPKSTVLIRQNKDVLFKYSGGKAIWTYIEKEYENSDSYAVKFKEGSIGSLNAEDTVIISGNLNLAHESDVQINE